MARKGTVRSADYTPAIGEIRLDAASMKSPDGATLEAILMHEPGHSLDLDHVGSGIMATPDAITLAFGDDDRAECRRAAARRVPF